MAGTDLELKERLQQIADKEKVLVMSFIAPDSIVRVSPASVDYAKIRVQDLYAIEKKIEKIRKENGGLPTKLHLIIHSPGGDLYASTKIAKYLQKLFGSNIKAFVPYEAASGGTILCLAANSIVMDPASNLTPIDPQVRYKGQRISVTSYEQALKDFRDDFGKLRPDELPSPYSQMANQFDPIIAKEMSRVAWDMLDVAYKLLLRSQEPDTPEDKSKLISCAFKLGNSDSPHSHVIGIDEAKNMGLNIDSSEESHALLMLYKEWVSDKLNEKTALHVIETYFPQEKKKGKNDKEEKGK